MKHILNVIALAASVFTLTSLPSFAQDTTRRAKATSVVYPIIFEKDSGTEGSRKTAYESLRGVMEKAGYTLIAEPVATGAWADLRIPMPTATNGPRAEEIQQFGGKVQADYVLTGTIHFHSRSIWVGLGPKTISTATVSVKLYDAHTGKLEYQKSGAQGRSDEREDALKAAGAILLTPFVTAVSGGPKTPHEQRAVQIAVARAMEGWVGRTVTDTK
jgi:hypothetical protein